jgi:anaerobic selenocysteine-containing dehydrogenase
MSPPPATLHYRACNLCEAICGIEIEHTGGEIVAIRGDRDDPFSRGHICPKAVALADIQNDPDRLRRPLRRDGSEWTEIGWPEALDEAAARIRSSRDEHGRDALAVYLGNPNIHNLGVLLYGPPLLRGITWRRSGCSATSCCCRFPTSTAPASC